MRARISWAAALALLLFVLALGLSALAGAAEPRSGAARAPGGLTPSLPASSWSCGRTHAAGPVRRGRRLQRHLRLRGRRRQRRRTTLDTFYRYNPVNERWDTYPPPMPAAVEMASAVYYPTTNSIYVFGGKNGSVFSDATRVFDITANTWTSAANMPAPRASMAAGYNTQREDLPGRRLRQRRPSSAQTTAWEYNPATNTFTTRAPIPHAVGGAASGVVNGELLVAGGRDAAGEIIDLVWGYNPATNTWTARPNLPSPTNAAGSAVASGKLWIFGGETPAGPTGTTAAYDRWRLGGGPEPERPPLADRGSGDRKHARRRRRAHRLDLDGDDRGARC